MKHPAYKRILSAVLAVVLLLSCVPGSIFANEAAPFRVVSPDGGAGLVELPRNCRTVLTAVDAPDGADLQWQIAMPDDQGWVDISGQEEATLTVSIAMFASVMDENNTASIRCAAIQGDSEYFTDPIQIQSTAPVMMDPPEETYPQIYEETTPEAIWEIFPESTEETTPETTVPETTVPETTVPETTVPETTVPETTVPETTVPETAVPETTVPETTVPETTVPETTVPETTVPETTVPETTIPETTAPVEDVIFEIVTEEEFSLVSGKPRIADNGGQPSSASGTINQIHTVTIDYYYREEGATSDTLTPVWESFTATIEKGKPLVVDVPNKNVPGFGVWVETKDGFTLVPDGTGSYIHVDIASVSEDVSFAVYYKKVPVAYHVRYFLQNIVNDLYTEDSGRYAEHAGLAGNRPNDEDINVTIPGFTSLFYEPDFVAADGSTVFEVYYDRNYYLINFELDGGYGVEPIYARYEYPLHVGEPTKPGYRFAGWELVKVNGQPATAEQKAQAFPTIIPYENRTYRARWETVDTTYTVVYWKENANDSGYSYWGSEQIGARSASTVHGAAFNKNAKHDGDVSQIEAELSYFTYNDVKTEKNIIVEGDGSTIVNVYYSRNYYTVYFKGTTGITGTCQMQPHTHGVDCSIRLLCGGASHIHDTTCNGRLVCTVTEHAIHDDTCLTCTLPEHLQHTASCLICGKTEHSAHTQACCTLSPHTHGTSCYELSQGKWDGNTSTNVNGTSADNGIVRTNNGRYYYKIGNTWHRITGLSTNWRDDNYWQNVTVTQTCTNQEHTHGDGCICNNELHTHTESCYRDSIHTHTKYCYKDEIHVHTDDCYSYDCSQTAHEHTDACYGDCIVPVHTHGTTCYQNNGSNILYVITAKYEADINWPSIDGVAYWSGNNNGTITQSSKVYTMTPNFCKTGGLTMTASAGKYKYYLDYYIEAVDQSAGAYDDTTGPDGIKYIRDPIYSQVAYYNQATTYGFKDITGMTAVTDGRYKDSDWQNGERQIRKTESGTSGTYLQNLFYYRNKYALKYYNFNIYLTDKEQPAVPYQKKLSDYEIVAADVPYPSTLEADAYTFAGWYTTPDCYPGTEMDWNTTMPVGDLTVYAKWEPITRTIEFYNTYDHMMGLTTDKAPIDTKTVKHGAFMTGAAPIPTHPQNNAEGTRYSFVGWFYMDENGQKAAFEPSEMEIRQDLKLYAEWKSPITTQYTISYKRRDTDEVIADAMSGYTFVATTKSFTAKSGPDLNLLSEADKNELWLPETSSHSILMKETPGENVFTFYYVKKDKAPYKVRYLEVGTNRVLRGEDYYPDNKNAIVTENFKVITETENGKPVYYTPDSFYKQLTLSADESQNVITFYYTRVKEDENQKAPYQVIHYVQNEDGNYIIYSEEAPKFADVGSTVSASPITINGYKYKEQKAFDAEDVPVTDNKLPAGGLRFELYYDRELYQYTVRYVDDTTDQVITLENDAPNPVTRDPVPYNTIVTEMAITIPGYTLIGDETQTLRIGFEEQNNVITFRYVPKTVTISYVPVCTVPNLTGFGSVMPMNQETPKADQLDKVQGATPLPASGYSFVGWYKSWSSAEGVKDPIPNTQVNPQTQKLIPVITQEDLTAKDEANQPYEFTYYALFEPITQSLTITKQGGKEGDTFLFHVKDSGEGIASADVIVSIQGNGSVTINDLYCGEYSVQELTGWSWTYTTDQPQKDVQLTGEGATVTFTNTHQTPDWLHGENHCENQFEPIT